MLTSKLEDALNTQLNNELYSAYLYMSMAAYNNDRGLKGFSKWFMAQYHEEMMHAMKIYEYIQMQGGKIELQEIKKPPSEFGSPLENFEQTLKHERFVTSCFNELADLAVQEKDHATRVFLQWFITEQIEEEDTDTDIINKLKMIGDDKSALFMMDKELSTRMVNVQTDFSGGLQTQK